MSSLWPRVRVFQWPDLAALGVTDWRACSGVHQRAYPSLSVRVPLTELEAEGFRASTSRGGSAADLLRCRKALFARHLTDRGTPSHRWTFHPVGRERAPDPVEWYPWPVATVVAYTYKTPSPPAYRRSGHLRVGLSVLGVGQTDPRHGAIPEARPRAHPAPPEPGSERAVVYPTWSSHVRVASAHLLTTKRLALARAILGKPAGFCEDLLAVKQLGGYAALSELLRAEFPQVFL